MKKPKVIVVMPAYNAAKTLEKTYRDIPKKIVDHIILVDDVSHDKTVEVAKKLGIKVVVHLQNKGYGGNQKTCYLEALKSGADIIVMLHPDYQYDSRLIPELIKPIEEKHADMVLGSRMLGEGALNGGMPLYKYIANRILTFIENLTFGKHYSELHTGFRAYSRTFLQKIPFLLNSDNFVFDSEVIAQAEAFRFKITEIPVPTRYFNDASSVNFKNSLIYGFSTLWVMVLFVLFRLRLIHNKRFSVKLGDIISKEYKNKYLKNNR